MQTRQPSLGDESQPASGCAEKRLGRSSGINPMHPPIKSGGCSASLHKVASGLNTPVWGYIYQRRFQPGAAIIKPRKPNHVTRNPTPNRELDRDPYWSFDETALLAVVKIRQDAQYFHQSDNRCPNCGCRCWEAEEPPIAFRGCACGTMAFAPAHPLHDHWETGLWGRTVSKARKALLEQERCEQVLAAGGVN